MFIFFCEFSYTSNNMHDRKIVLSILSMRSSLQALFAILIIRSLSRIIESYTERVMPTYLIFIWSSSSKRKLMHTNKKLITKFRVYLFHFIVQWTIF